jgi:hypothetical protein
MLMRLMTVSILGEEDCKEYERLLPILQEIVDSVDTLEIGEHDVISFLRELRKHLDEPCFERYLFNHRKEFATLADLLKPITHEG